MLEGLDKINWSKIHHCFGPATNLPDLLRNLASPDQEVVDHTIPELFHTIWHQGTVYEASAYAVPFLYELAASSEVLDRCSVLELIGFISRGCQSLEDKNGWRDNKNFQREMKWSKAANKAALEGLNLALEWLKDPEFRFRIAAAYLLSTFPESRPTVQPAIEAALEREQDEMGRAALGLALALIGSYHHEAFVTKGPNENTVVLLNIAVMAERTAEGKRERTMAFDTLIDIGEEVFTQEDFFDRFEDWD